MSKIEITGCGSGADRAYFCVQGEGAGEQGVILGHGQVEGIYDAPVSMERRSMARQRGGTVVNKNWGVRELSLGFHVTGKRHGAPAEWAEIDSDFRSAFTYDDDEVEWDQDWQPARIDWLTDQSGVRSLDVVLREMPEFKPDVNPLINEYGNPILPLAADQPFWYQPDATREFTTTATSATGWIEMPGNPTDIPAFQRWVLTRGEWTLPDVSWRGRRGHRAPGGEYGGRMIELKPITTTQGGLVIDLDPEELMVRDAHDTNAIGYMLKKPSQFFMHVIPPYTPPCWLPISVKNAPAGGAMARLSVPRLWSKPWGLEQPMAKLGPKP
ncbi:hypothetical protein [Gordonia rubripertincta]|uniref:hypothetical protein n=1 Tax=Gordonia rubripertincta TaxID=36822 RepID=UPI003FD73539